MSMSIAIEQAGREEAFHFTSARRLAMLIASLSASLLFGIAFADGIPRGEFAVWAIGLPNSYVIMEHQAQAVEVSAGDVARGTLEVKGGTRIVVTTTDAGIAVDFHSPGKLFRSIQIDSTGS